MASSASPVKPCAAIVAAAGRRRGGTTDKLCEKELLEWERCKELVGVERVEDGVEVKGCSGESCR